MASQRDSNAYAQGIEGVPRIVVAHVEMSTVYEAYWNDRFMGAAASDREACELILSHYAYGDPTVPDAYYVGTEWAQSECDSGWRVVSKETTVHVVYGKVSGIKRIEGGAHIAWQCPLCGRRYSDSVDS